MTRLQDDFYQAVNGEWLATATIPEDKPATGGFYDIDRNIENLMLETTDQWLRGENLPDDAILKEFIKYHGLVSDWETREAIGIKPARDLIAIYQKRDSFLDYTAHLVSDELSGRPNLMPFGISPDFKNARQHVLWAYAPSTILPDTSFYEEGNEKGVELLALWRQTQKELLLALGWEEEAALEILDKVIALDAKLAKYVLSSEEQSEYAKRYHPYTFEDFIKLAPELPLEDFFTEILGQVPDKIIVPEERFWTEFAKDYYCADNWDALKATLLYAASTSLTSYLTEDIRVLAGAYQRALSGVPEPINQRKAAYYLAQAPYNQALGLWYAKEKFSPEAKADVETKVDRMIAVYKERLIKNDWLDQATINQAIVKLDAIVSHIGYPEKLPETYAKKIVDESLSLVENAGRFLEISIKHSWSKWNQPVDRAEWHMPAHMVNAYYDPQQNQIVFPAAILQAPFYSLEQSSSANYGGIGAVIAHEISHAFDTNGASFDEFGSLKDWWTETDYKTFTSKTQAVIDQFDGLDSYGAKVNGKLTVSENVADLGGLAASLQAAKAEEDFSAHEYFTNFARIWRMTGREEYMQLVAAVDVHAPAKLRTNVQLPNFDEFFDTFQIQEGDGMWRAKTDRIEIW